MLVALALAAMAGSAVLPREERAAADPVGDAQAQAQAIAQRLEQLGRQAQVLDQQINGAQALVVKLGRQVHVAQHRVVVSRQALVERKRRLARDAVAAYVAASGGGVTMVDDLGRIATRAGSRSTYWSVAVGDRQELVDQLRSAKIRSSHELTALRRLRAAAQQASRQARSRRAQLEAVIAEQQDLQAQANSRLAAAVSAQQQALAAQQQARARQALHDQLVQRGASPTQVRALTTAPAASGASAGTAGGTTGGTPAGPGATTAAAASTPPAPTTGTASSRPASTAPLPTTSTSAAAPPPPAAPAPPARYGSVVQAAMSQVGGRYVWGGASPVTGFDCSGLVMWAYAQVGVSLPHFAQSQYAMSRRIAASALAPGDLVFYADRTGYVYHVALYIGGGEVVQALNPHYGILVGSLYSAGAAPSAYGRI